MKRNDILFIIVILALFLPFFIFQPLYEFYCKVNAEHGLLMSFLKFGILATVGESLGLRIRKGVYNYSGFGLLPRAVVWGLLGVAIKVSFVIFQNGSVSFLDYLGYNADATFGYNLLKAFTASALMNLIFAPVMMSIHKVTDTHIVETGGTLRGFFSRIDVASILQKVDWRVMWGFVFKKSIPFFWIPAHTITFLLPVAFQVLFAAVLGIVLGVILAFAANKAK